MGQRGAHRRHSPAGRPTGSWRPCLLGKWAPREFFITGTCSYGGLWQRGVRDGGAKHPWSRRKGTSVLTGSRCRCCTSADAARGPGAA
eukprot:scaffold142756_cov193-Phaeocystis_antarctica.AAC.1